ncbi:MAG: SDR family oxidoreductase [Candidatus Thorarchaeota archaeon]
MDLQLREKTLLVTAASKGLGLGVARALASEGANVIICSRNEDALKEAVTALGDRGEYVVADVTRVDDIVRLMEHVRETYSALDGMFVNAGGPPPGPFESLSDHDWQAAFELTLMSAVRLTREALPLLKVAESPSILYNTSISVKEPIDNLLLSNAIRPAVVGMMRTLSREIGPMGIRVNAVCPGWVRTDRVKQLLAKSPSREGEIVAQIPLGRMGTPDEFGAVCAFLLSPVSSYIHGALLLIDGGLYHGMM